MTAQRRIAVAVMTTTGQGTHTKYAKLNVLQPLGAKSILHHVLDNVRHLQIAKTFVVIEPEADNVIAALKDREDIQFVHRDARHGTGHVLQQLMPSLDEFDGDLIVTDGNMPLLRPESVSALIEYHHSKEALATMLTSRVPDPADCSRIFCGKDGRVHRFVGFRQRDADELESSHGSVGISCFKWPDLAVTLRKETLDNDVAIHDLGKILGPTKSVEAFCIGDYEEVLRINDFKQLATAYKILQNRQKERWMAYGVMFLDPDSVTIDETVEIGENVVIEPQTHLRGKTRIGDGCCIGPGALVENSEIGARCKVRFSVVSDSAIADDTWIGPYTHLRANARLGEGCRVGNFVEIKNASLGNSTFAAHLSYVGDAELGNNVNIGAGTITANFDGFKKHKTVIRDGAKTGSNSVLVAPITIGSRVTIGAGSTVTEDVQDNALVVARARQVVKPDWKPRRK